MRNLHFGLNGYAPADATIVWGARAILEGRSYSLLPDRQDCVSVEGADRQAFKVVLDRGLAAAREKVAELKDAFELRADMHEDFILYEDDEVCIMANPRASYGYLYMVGWLK